MKIKVYCADGSDRNCYDTVEIELPFSGLTPEHVTAQREDERGRQVAQRVKIAPPNLDWIGLNKQLLSQSDIESIEENGYFEFEYDKVCEACGSDQTYDDEGNNISAL